MRKAIKIKAKVGGKIMTSILIATLAFGVFTGCTSPSNIALEKSTATSLAKTDAAQAAYDFVQKVKDKDYQGIQNEDDRLKYLKIDAVASLVNNTINSDVIHDDAYELTSIEEEEYTDDLKKEKFIYTKKDKSNADEKEFTLIIDLSNEVLYDTTNTNVKSEIRVKVPYNTECSIEGIELDKSKANDSNYETGLDTYIIPYLADEFRATCTTADWGNIDIVSKVDKNYTTIQLKFPIDSNTTSEIFEATKKMYNEIMSSYLGKSVDNTVFEKYVTPGYKGKQLTKEINRGVASVTVTPNQKIGAGPSASVTYLKMTDIGPSDRIDTPVYVFNDSGEVYVEAKVSHIYTRSFGKTENISDTLHTRYRVMRDNSNTSGTGWIFTWFDTNNRNKGYPELFGPLNDNGWWDTNL